MNATKHRHDERKKGAAWARTLSSTARGEFIDEHVLGDFDWRNWFEIKPTNYFINAAFTEAQSAEECAA